ncbi:MAG: universal stress protein [Myxococcales bacterium]|nr:universal stress protein [Myxococcales bacterium]
MAKIDVIVCPIDFSECSEFALTYAASMAKTMGARLTLLHVLEPLSGIFPDDSLAVRAELESGLRRERETELQLAVKRCQQGVPELEVRGELVEGVAQAAIAKGAAECGADLIVIGTHGRTGLGHLLLGSVAEKVVRTSTVPVLTVRKPG